jgi:peptidoglycan/xylan/chitin deacetylase (PgdA/CDA1 family)
MLRSLSDTEIRIEIAETNELIAGATNEAPIYWRAPGFHSDARVRDVVRAFGLREIGCSIDPADYSHGSTAQGIAAAIIEHADFRPGAIVDLHDGRAPTDGNTTAPTRQATVEAVGLLVEELDVRGLRSVTISELLAAR